MACTCQQICVNAKDQFAVAFPEADAASNGCCASAQHTAQNPTSGHEAGIALDQDADLIPGFPGTMHDVTRHLAAMMLAGLLPEIDYLIYNRQIFNPEIARFWRPYTGSNSHETHVHIEFYWEHRNGTPDLGLRTMGDLFMPDQFETINRKLDTLIEITAKRGALARLNARVKSVLRGERRSTERNARGR